jgi:catechol 2,3-dioxygenase-like lactoylglutathione lyase family enzyme
MTQPTGPSGLLRKVDCVQLPVPDLEGGLAFYRDRLGHELLWRTETAAGLRLVDSDTELVLQTQRARPEVDFLVGSVDQAVTQLTRAGGRVVVEPFEIPVGRVAVVADPFENPLTILDLTKGRYRTDADANVTGVAAPLPEGHDPHAQVQGRPGAVVGERRQAKAGRGGQATAVGEGQDAPSVAGEDVGGDQRILGRERLHPQAQVPEPGREHGHIPP